MCAYIERPPVVCLILIIITVELMICSPVMLYSPAAQEHGGEGSHHEPRPTPTSQCIPTPLECLPKVVGTRNKLKRST